MKDTLTIPKGPWYNPDVPEGIYDAKITDLTPGQYGPDKDPYIRIVFWLPQVEQHFVTNLYFPGGQSDSRSVQRLGRLCQCVGLSPQDALESPGFFRGCELKLKLGACKKDGLEYRDVDLFLHLETMTA